MTKTRNTAFCHKNGIQYYGSHKSKLVTCRKVWKDIVRKAKAHNGVLMEEEEEEEEEK